MPWHGAFCAAAVCVSPPRDYPLRLQLDSGSNANILCNPEAFALCSSFNSSGVIGGISGSLEYTAIATCSVQFGVDRVTSTLSFLFAPLGVRNILSESLIVDNLGITVQKLPVPHLLLPGGATVPVVREHGLYFINLRVKAPAPSISEPAPPAVVRLAARNANDTTAVWAARLGQGADSLLRTVRASRGIDIPARLSPAQREAIGGDAHRAISLACHASASSTPYSDLATLPGETFICDVFGPHSAPFRIDRSVVQFKAICEFEDLLRLHP